MKVVHQTIIRLTMLDFRFFFFSLMLIIIYTSISFPNMFPPKDKEEFYTHLTHPSSAFTSALILFSSLCSPHPYPRLVLFCIEENKRERKIRQLVKGCLLRSGCRARNGNQVYWVQSPEAIKLHQLFPFEKSAYLLTRLICEHTNSSVFNFINKTNCLHRYG